MNFGECTPDIGHVKPEYMETEERQSSHASQRIHFTVGRMSFFQFSSLLAVLCSAGVVAKTEHHIDTVYTGSVALDRPRLYRVRAHFFLFSNF